MDCVPLNFIAHHLPELSWLDLGDSLYSTSLHYIASNIPARLAFLGVNAVHSAGFHVLDWLRICMLYRVFDQLEYMSLDHSHSHAFSSGCDMQL